MSAPVKLGMGLLGISAVAIPGIWMAITVEPSATTVADDSETAKKYENKFGEYFRYHFVDAREGQNVNWWNWSFKYRWQEEKDGDFKDITSGDSLREKCKEAYEKETNENMRASGKESYEKVVWRYCSFVGQAPITVKNSKGESNHDETIGKTKEADLVSTKDAGNSKFWEIQEKAFFKATNGLGSKSSQGSVFKSLYEGKQGTLRKICQEVYEKKGASDVDKKDALLFCSLATKPD